MKPTILIAFTILVFCATGTAPALAEQDWMQLVDPDRMIMLDENSDGVVNGHDWLLMSENEKGKAVTLMCGTHIKVTRQLAKKSSDLDDTDNSVIKKISDRVVFDLNAFYANPANRGSLLSIEVVVLFYDELQRLKDLTQ